MIHNRNLVSLRAKAPVNLLTGEYSIREGIKGNLCVTASNDISQSPKRKTEVCPDFSDELPPRAC